VADVAAEFAANGTGSGGGASVPDFTLTSVDPDPKPWTGDHGTFLIYKVSFEGEQGRGDAEMKTKSSSPAPTAGQVIDAEIVQKGGRPPELKRIWKDTRSNGKPKGGDYRSPEQIMRGFAHMNALKYWELKHASDPEFAFASWQDYLKIVDLFFADIEGAA
jgi:hypothetical protein